jgi:hypothetical protein
MFDDIFRPGTFDKNAHPKLGAILEEWTKLGRSGTVHVWRGRDEDFYLARDKVKERYRHPTIKKMFPYVMLGVLEKPSIGNPISFVVKMFLDGWMAFIDKKTKFEPRILLALGNQAYLDGDFIIEGVHYTRDDLPNSDVHETDKLTYYRKLIVTETKSRMVICMAGVPHVSVPEREKRTITKYYDHVDKLIRRI